MACKTSALIWIIDADYLEGAEAVIELGQITREDVLKIENDDVLLAAVGIGSVAMVRLLIEKLDLLREDITRWITIEDVEDFFHSPIERALYQGDIDIIKVLIEVGSLTRSDLFIKAKDGYSALSEIACDDRCDNSLWSVIQVLLKLDCLSDEDIRFYNRGFLLESLLRRSEVDDLMEILKHFNVTRDDILSYEDNKSSIFKHLVLARRFNKLKYLIEYFALTARDLTQ